MDRPTPFDLVFSGLAPDRFPAIREALTATGADPRDRDAFLLTQPAMALLRELRPDDAEAGTGLEELTALVHHAYLTWAAGLCTWTIPAADVRRLLTSATAPGAALAGAGYIQFPEHLIWASLSAPGPWEPLDGCFVHAEADDRLRVLGVFGMHESRDGFTVAEAHGWPGARTTRRDGTPLFAPSLEGGESASLHAVIEPDELVEVAARVLAHPGLVSVRLEDA